MAKVTNYKVSIETDQIVKNLHEAAMKDAKVGEGSGFSLVNTLILAEKEVSGVNPQIMLTMEDGSTIEPSRKKEFTEKIKDYITFFAGKNYANMVDESDVHPIFNAPEKPEETPEPEPETTSESRVKDTLFINRGSRMVSEDVDSFFGGVLVTEADDDETSDKPADEKDMDVKGYAVDFLFYKGGKQTSMLGGKPAKTSKFFSGMLADLANFKIATSYGNIPIGKYISKMSRAVRATKVNINDVDNHIRNVIKNKMPQSSAIVRVYDCPSLSSTLMYSQQWRPEYQSLFNGCEYAVTIEVEKRDKAYEQYNRKMVSEICTMAFGDANKVFKLRRNVVKEDGVIKIENYKSEYRSQSIYDKRSSGKDGASSTSESIFYSTSNTGMMKILESLFGKNAVEEYLIEESNRHTMSQISSDILIPYIKKHGTTKFKWNDTQSDAAFQANFKGQKYGNSIKQALDQMSKYGDVQELADGEPLSKFKGEPKDSDSRNTLNGIYVCLKKMFENTTPPQEGDEGGDGGGNEIQIQFVKKDPRDEGSAEQIIKTLSGEPGKFDESSFPTYDDIKIEGLNFTEWKPEPNSMTEDGKTFAKYTQPPPGDVPPPESGSGDISVFYKYTNPNKENAWQEKWLMTQLVKSEDLGKDGQPGKIDTTHATEKLKRVLGDDINFKHWNPDPNDIGIEDLDGRKSITTSAKFGDKQQEGSQISVKFFYKDPVKGNARESMVYQEVVSQDKLGNIDLSAARDKVNEIAPSGYSLSVWNPDPNDFQSMDDLDGQNVIRTNAVMVNISDGEISVKFLFKNPDKKNPLEQTLSTYVIDSDDKFGKIPVGEIQNHLPRFDTQFQYWNPDPNELNRSNTRPGQTVEVRAVFSNEKPEDKDESDLYIIPDKNLVSDNRKDAYDVASDGTVTAKQNMADYKNTDFQE